MEEQRREILLKIDFQHIIRKYFSLGVNQTTFLWHHCLVQKKSLFTISIFLVSVEIIKLSTKYKLFFKTLSQFFLFIYICLYKNFYIFLNSGTPSQETWPGVSSNDEFKNYNFPKYKPQPLINHAPRYFFFFSSLSERGGTHLLFFFFSLLKHQLQ